MTGGLALDLLGSPCSLVLWAGGRSVVLMCVRVVAFSGPDCEMPVRKQPADCLRWCHREVWWRVCTNSAVRSVSAHPSRTWPVTGLSPSPQLRPMWTDSWSPLYLKLRSSDRWHPSGRAANVRPLPCTFWNSQSEARDPGYCLSPFRFGCWLLLVIQESVEYQLCSLVVSLLELFKWDVKGENNAPSHSGCHLA